MSNIKFVDVDLGEAVALADLSGAATDLEDAQNLAEYLTDRFASGAVAHAIVDAFSTAILVKYARPFMTGVRGRLGPEILAGLTPHQIQLHENFLAWRSKHIAHSVNPFEENQVVAYYDENTVAETGIQNIAVQQYHVVGLSPQDLVDIQTLADAILALVQTRIDAEAARVLQIVRGRPVEAVLAVGTKPRSSAGMESVSRARKRD